MFPRMSCIKILRNNYHTLTSRFLIPSDIVCKHGYVGEIFVKIGQKVKKDDSIMTIETDKSPIDERALINGTVSQILVDIDSNIDHKTKIFSIDFEANDNLS